jgi:hypothetical protein
VRWVKLLGAALAALLAAIQLVRPERVNPPEGRGAAIESHVRIPEAIAALLDRS